jgi:hypothetical protein
LLVGRGAQGSYPHVELCARVTPCYNCSSGVANDAVPNSFMSSNSSRKKFTTGVSLEPEVVRSLDELVVQTGLNRSWVLNTIVLEYLRLAQQGNVTDLITREGIINV